MCINTHLLYFLLFKCILSQYVNELVRPDRLIKTVSLSGEYRSRTDDLLRARQAL